ncbi:MAG: sigma-E factor negative regulatory protein [Gammaproteobacteria bacterium]|nr:sigma-E factor negative regulatory protein [Gammaproteobacteria bacterium]
MDQSGHESNEFLDQDLSAAIDNELSADDFPELIEHLGQEPEMQRKWERHHTINALLRGEQIGVKNQLPWERIHANFDVTKPQHTTTGIVIDFASFRERHLPKVVGGMAMAASVVLAVSLFITMQSPVQNIQAPLAAESSQPSEQAKMRTATENDQSSQVIEPELRLPPTNQSDVYLAADRETRQSPIPPSDSQRQSRAFPTDQPKPNSDLIHLVSD